MRFEGSDLSSCPRHARAALGIGYMPEDRCLVPQLTVEENIMLPLWVAKHLDRKARLDFVYEVIGELTEMRHRKALLLSGGQQKLVALGRALAIGTKCLLLDEPFEGIAPALSERLSEVLASLKGKDLTLADVAIGPESLARPDRYGIHDRTWRQSLCPPVRKPGAFGAPAGHSLSWPDPASAISRSIIGIQHDDRAVLEPHPIAAGPGAQLLVDALAGHADHLADLLLGDRDGPALRGRNVSLFRQAKQRAGQPSRQVLQDDLFDLIAGRSQPLAEQFDELHRQRGLSLHKGDEARAGR